MRLTQWLDECFDDLKSGFRQLGAAPGFALVAITVLALGIGANAAIFGVAKSVLLDALPYADADSLVRVWGGVRTTPQIGPVSAGTVSEIRTRQRSFASLAAFDYPSEMVFNANDGPQLATGVWVEPQLFETLGVFPILGRTFRADEGGNGLAPLSAGQLASDNARVVMLTDATWERLFRRDPLALGRSVRINDVERTVVGVLPPGFIGPMGEADLFLPLDLAPVVAHPLVTRRSGWLGLVARLDRGVTVEAAGKDVASIWADFERQYPDDNRSLGIATVPLRDAMVGDTRTPLLVLVASAALVLLVACANLAATLLSRALARRKEFAVRIALGAGRGRIIRQSLTEAVLLAACGGVAGVALAVYGLGLLRTLATTSLPAYADLSLDRGAILVTALVTIVTGMLFGMVPAMAAGRRDTHSVLRDESRGASESLRSQRLRGLLVAGQLALCLSLLVGAGLLARSLYAMTSAPIGIDQDHVLTATVRLPATDYATDEARAGFHDRLLERLRALPGVESVGTTTALPTPDIGQVGMTIDGVPTPDTGQPFVLAMGVSNDYFSTLRIPLQQGRVFGEQDLPDRPLVALVSESMARRYWPRGNAIGSRMRLGPDPNAPWTQVIGIVGDVRNDRVRPDAAPILYGSVAQNPRPFMRLLIRTAGDPLALTTSVQRALADIDPGVPLRTPATLDAVVNEGLSGRRLPALLMMAFGILALVLASVGVYAMFANMAASREREFGVRMALGSGPGQIASLVLRQGAGWAAVGLAGGAVGIAVIARLVQQLLYDVGPFDPLTLAVSLVLLLTCAMLALLLPLWRATRVDPAIALKA